MKRLTAFFLITVLLIGLIPSAFAGDTQYVYDDCIVYTLVRMGSKDVVKIVGYLDTLPEEVTIPAEIDGYPVWEIGYKAFMDCTQLKTIHLPEGLWQIDQLAFYNCCVSGFLEIPVSVQKIEDSAFTNTNLTGIYYHGKPLTIGNDTALRFIIMTDEWFAIKGNSMGREGHERIFLSESEALPDILSGHFSEENGNLYLVCDQYSYLLRGADQPSVTVPAAVEGKPLRWIMDKAFQECRQLQIISLPEGLERIRPCAFHTTGLTALELPASCTRLDEYAFYNNPSLMTVDLTHVRSLGKLAFAYSGLETVTLGNELTELGGCEFSHTRLRQVDIPPCVPKLGATFAGCESLTELTLHEGLTKFTGAVADCPNITSLTLPSTVEEVSNLTANNGIRTLEIPGAVRTLHELAFGYGSQLDSLTLNEGLETIELGAFWGLSGLTELRLPASVTLVQDVPKIKNLCVYFHSGTRFDLNNETERTIRYINVDTG